MPETPVAPRKKITLPYLFKKVSRRPTHNLADVLRFSHRLFTGTGWN